MRFPIYLLATTLLITSCTKQTETINPSEHPTIKYSKPSPTSINLPTHFIPVKNRYAKKLTKHFFNQYRDSEDSNTIGEVFENQYTKEQYQLAANLEKISLTLNIVYSDMTLSLSDTKFLDGIVDEACILKPNPRGSRFPPTITNLANPAKFTEEYLGKLEKIHTNPKNSLIKVSDITLY